MEDPQAIVFTRYLAAKRSVDDRSLNHHVRMVLTDELHAARQDRRLSVLEIGAGSGAMIERLLSWKLLGVADYTALDLSADNISESRLNLQAWTRRNSYHYTAQDDDDLLITGENQVVKIHLIAMDLFNFIPRQTSRGVWDLLLAHAFLDLIDLPAALPALLGLLKPGGLFYFTLNFDGETILEPVIDPSFDALVIELYHRSMDERLINGFPSGDSRSGRHLFAHLAAAGAEILAAGASDWVVSPIGKHYLADEAIFLHFIIQTIHKALIRRPELDPAKFQSWIAERHAQIDRCQMIYIAHQMDFVGRTRSDRT